MSIVPTQGTAQVFCVSYLLLFLLGISRGYARKKRNGCSSSCAHLIWCLCHDARCGPCRSHSLRRERHVGSPRCRLMGAGTSTPTVDEEETIPPVAHQEVDIVLHGVPYKAFKKSVSISESTPLKTAAGPRPGGHPAGLSRGKSGHGFNDAGNRGSSSNRLENFRQ